MSNDIFKAKQFISDNFTANKSFFSCHKRSRIQVSPRMKVGVSPTMSPGQKRLKKTEIQMIATVQSRCVRLLAYKVQSHTCSVHEADSTESAAAVAFALTPLSSSESKLIDKQDCSIQCTLLATPRHGNFADFDTTESMEANCCLVKTTLPFFIFDKANLTDSNRADITLF